MGRENDADGLVSFVSCELCGVLEPTLRADVVQVLAVADQALGHRHLAPGAGPIGGATGGADLRGGAVPGHRHGRDFALGTGHGVFSHSEMRLVK